MIKIVSVAEAQDKKGKLCDEREYSVRTRCTNCEMDFFLIIPKGTTKYDYTSNGEAQKVKCEHCGCNPFKILGEFS